MADLSTVLTNVITEVGNDIKTLKASQGDLSALTTQQKTSLVVAVNELKAEIGKLDFSSIIDDKQTATNKVWSSSKTTQEIANKCAEVKNAILGGAGTAYDTLQELATLINANKDLITSLQELAGAHIRYDQAQDLSESQKTQARTNIGAASSAEVTTLKGTVTTQGSSIGTLTSLTTSAKTNLVGAINEVKGIADSAKTSATGAQSTATAANSAASKAQGDVNTLKAAVGNTSVDLVAIYQAARDGSAP